MSLSATTIATAIANLSVSGVTIKDLTNSTLEATRGGLPLLQPDPDNFGGNMAVEGGEGPGTFGTPSTRFWQCSRALGYIYYHAPIGSNRNNPYEFMSAISNNRDAIIEKILELADMTGIDIVGVASGQIGIVSDLAGGRYHGFTLTVSVRESVNA